MKVRYLAATIITTLIITATPVGASGPSPCTMSKQEFRAIPIGLGRVHVNVIAQCTGVFRMNQDTPEYSQRIVRWAGEAKHDYALIVFRNAHVLRKVYVSPSTEEVIR